MISCSYLMFSPTAYHATEPIDCKGGRFSFFMVGTPPYPSHAAHFLLSTSQSTGKPILRGEI
jgi:hypothetical protein